MPLPQYLSRPRDNKYSQRQPNYWVTEYEGARYEKELGAGYNPKEKKWPQGNGYRKRYGTGKENETGKSQEEMVGISQQKVLVMNRVGMGEMRVEMIRRNLEILNMTLKIKGKKRVIQKILVN